MDKGEFGSSLGTEMFMKIHRFPLSPAAAVTTYAAVRASSRLHSLRSHRSPGACCLPHPHWGCVTIPVDIPNCSSLGMGGNGMDKGDFRSSLAPEISPKIHRFSCSPLASELLESCPSNRVVALVA
jgi:hypothetical protein